MIVGRVVRPHGVRGEIAMKVLTDYPERLADVEMLYVGPNHEPYTVEHVRSHKIGRLIKFKEVNDRDEAEALRELFVHVHISDAVPLEEGEYYLYQLEGMKVVTDEGVELGVLTGYIETGANDVYIITTPEGKEILIPAIPDVIKNVDLEAKAMTVTLLEGLI
ncbi:MAG: 16S rRNA processing protein RimM [Chloroflexi bacterium]|nr:16S rRNA processing protein RimM [Chloroflexota bacterium]